MVNALYVLGTYSPQLGSYGPVGSCFWRRPRCRSLSERVCGVFLRANIQSPLAQNAARAIIQGIHGARQKHQHGRNHAEPLSPTTTGRSAEQQGFMVGFLQQTLTTTESAS